MRIEQAAGWVMQNRRWAWSGGCVLLLLAAGAWVWPARAQQAAPAVKSSRPVQAKDCFVVLMDEVKLSLERPGILSSISVREGDTVPEGQNLALLRDDVARAALAVAEEEASSDVDIRYAQKAAEVAQVEYEKTAEVNLRLPKTIPELEVLRARLAWDKTLLETEKAEHTHQVNILKRDEAKVQLQTFRIDSPFDGFVTRVYFSRGASIKQGDPVIELVSTKKVKVEGSISLLNALSVRPGAPVEVQIVLPGEAALSTAAAELQKRKFLGKLVFVDVVTKKLESTVRVWAEVENVDNALRAGLKAAMTILPSTE